MGVEIEIQNALKFFAQKFWPYSTGKSHEILLEIPRKKCCNPKTKLLKMLGKTDSFLKHFLLRVIFCCEWLEKIARVDSVLRGFFRQKKTQAWIGKNKATRRELCGSALLLFKWLFRGPGDVPWDMGSEDVVESRGMLVAWRRADKWSGRGGGERGAPHRPASNEVFTSLDGDCPSPSLAPKVTCPHDKCQMLLFL